MPSTKGRACKGKTPYDTQKGAMAGLRYYMGMYGAASGSMETYKCSHCHKFHFGHKRRRKAR